MRSYALKSVHNNGRIGVLGFRNDPKAILVGLTLALIIIVFTPALKWIVWRFPFSKQSLRVRYIEMSVPRSWIVKQNGNPVGAWKPCMTIICTPPTASFQIAVNEELAGSDDAWLLATRQAFEEGHYSRQFDRVLTTAIGSMRCIEGKSSNASREIVASSCFEQNSGALATFEGAESFLPEFYASLKTAHAVR